jgi:uncharacterized protein involved in outer membrane biogenesis
MKIFKKVLKITGIVLASFLLFLIIVVLVAKLFEDDLATIAMDELGKEIEAPMSIGKVSVIPLFSFPRFSAEINDLWVGDPNSSHHDSLLWLQSVKVGLDTWDLIHGKYTVEKMELSGLTFSYTVDTKGRTNIDFLMEVFLDTTQTVEPDPVAESESYSLFLTAEKARIQNVKVRYYDSLTNIAATIIMPEINLKIKSLKDSYQIGSEGEVRLSNIEMEGTKISRMKSWVMNFDVEMKDDVVQINRMMMNTEGLNLALEGRVAIGDTLELNTHLFADEIDLNILQKYVPDEYLSYLDYGLPTDMEAINLGADVKYFGDAAIINNIYLKTAGLDLQFAGNLSLADTISINTKIDGKEVDLGTLKKYVPAKILSEYGISDFGGELGFTASIDGKYADSTLMPSLDADVNLKNFSLLSKDYPKIDALNFSGTITNSDLSKPENTSIDIASLEIFTPESAVNLKGEIEGHEKMAYRIEGSAQIHLPEFQSFIPDTLAKNLTGEINMELATSGVLPDSITQEFTDYVLNRSKLSLTVNDVSGIFMDSLQIDDFGFGFNIAPVTSGVKNIQVKNLKLNAESMNLDLSNGKFQMYLLGKISDVSQLAANISDFNIQQGSNVISGKVNIKNIEMPEYDLDLSIHLNLPELMPLMPDSLINSISGRASLNVQSAGIINPDSIQAELYPIIFENSRFKLSCSNVSVAFPDSIMNVEKLTAGLQLENDELTVNKFSATYNGLKISIDSTRVKNIYKAVLLNKPEELYVNTHLHLGDINFNDFKDMIPLDYDDAVVETNAPEPEPPGQTDEEPQNWSMLVHGSFSASSLSMDTIKMYGYQFNKVLLEDISANFKVTDSAYIIDQFKFNAFDGAMNNSFFFRVRDDGTETVSSRHSVKGIDIRMMLRDLDNLELDSMITWQNINGRLSSELNMFYPLDSTMIEKMLISGDIVLEDGGVFDYAPAQEMSTLPGLKDLDDIQFKTLRSSIFMFKNRIWIPRTHIVSSALDIAAFGMFDMNYDYDYRFEIHLSDILFGKSKKRTKKQDAKGEEVNEETLKKSSRKIRYADVDGETKMGLDSKESREQMMNRIRTQERMLNFIFLPENIHYDTDVEEKK